MGRVKSTTQAASAKRDVLVVANLDPFHSNINGFSPRLRSFLGSLAEHATVDFVMVEGTASSDRQLAPEVDTESGLRSFRTPLPPNPLFQHTALRPIWQIRHFTTGVLPSTAHPSRLAILDSLHAAHDHQLLVYYLPSTAHFSLSSPPGTRQLCVLEEGLERRYMAPVGEGPVYRRVRRRLVAEGELRRWARLYRRIAESGAQATVISDIEREWFERFFSPELITVLPHGIDIEYFSGTPRKVFDFDVAVFGDFAMQRNARPLRALLEATQRSGQRWRWAIVGNQPEHPARYPGDPHVTGFVSDIRPYYERAAVVVVPASGGTGVKTTLLQGWSMGRPVVASPDAILGVPATDGENIVIGKNPVDMIRVCGEILDSPEMQLRLSAAGRRTAEKHCDIRFVSRQFAEVCIKMMRRSPGRGS